MVIIDLDGEHEGVDCPKSLVFQKGSERTNLTVSMEEGLSLCGCHCSVNVSSVFIFYFLNIF